MPGDTHHGRSELALVTRTRWIAPRVALVAALMTGLVFVQTYSTLSGSSLGLVRHLSSYRNVYLLGAIAMMAVLAIRDPRLNRAAAVLGIFSAYTLANLVARGELAYGVMFVLWFGYIALVFPSLRFQGKELEDLVIYGVVGLTVLLGALYYTSLTYNLSMEWDPYARARFTSGLANPSIYVRVASTTLWLALLAYILRRQLRYLAIAAVAVVLVRASDVRADLLGVVVGAVVFVTDYRRHWRTQLALFVVVTAMGVWMFSGYSYDEINDWSSGRLEVWNEAIDASYDGSMVTYLFGTGHSVVYNPFTEKTYHYDNLYLEVLLRYGLVGFFLFMYGIWQVLRQIHRRSRAASTAQERALYAWAKGALSALLVISSFATVIPSLGNSINVILLPLILRLASSGNLLVHRT